jgi:hypothetical protein
MVQVGGLINQLDIGKAKKKCNDSSTVKQADNNQDSSKDQQTEKHIHPCGAKRSYPIKPVKGKMKFRFDIKGAYPSLQYKPDDADQHNAPEGDPEYRQRGNMYRVPEKGIKTSLQHSLVSVVIAVSN